MSTLHRRTPLRRVSPARLRMLSDPVVQAAMREWARVARSRRCAMCGTRHYLTGHHVLPLQQLRRAGVPPEAWFDTANLLVLCMDPSPARCHDRHEQHVRRVPREIVLGHAPRAHLFAAQWALVWLFDREYGS